MARNAVRAPVISVIVTTFERRDFVRRAVASARAQRFRDFELIVVDDGSGDGTREALLSLDPSIRYLWQPNRGVAAARNAGLECARGEIVTFLDSDDRWLPEHLDVIVALLRAHPSAVLASTSPRWRRRGHQRLTRAQLVEPFPAILTRGLAGFPSSTAVRRINVEAVGGFDERLKVGEDADLWLRLALCGQFVLLRRRTVEFGSRPDSLSAHGRRDGTQLAGYALSLDSVASNLERRHNPRAAIEVRGALGFVRALQMLDADVASAIEDTLASACRALPALSRDWGYGMHLAGLTPSGRDPRLRLRRRQALATAWPDRRSPLVVALRVDAALTALRLGHPRVAAALLARVSAAGVLRLVANSTATIGGRLS